MENKNKGSYILIYIILGFLLGAGIGFVYYNKLFEIYLTTLKNYALEDYKKTEAYANKIIDQAVKLRKMLTDNKIKYDNAIFEKIFDTRSRLLGADNINEKVLHLKEYEENFNKILEFYNSRMDLRNKRFGYIEWGIETKEYLEEYVFNKDRYRDSSKEYNEKLKKIPLTLITKRKKYSPYPELSASIIIEPKIKTEKYIKDDLKEYKEEQDKPVEAVAEENE